MNGVRLVRCLACGGAVAVEAPKDDTLQTLAIACAVKSGLVEGCSCVAELERIDAYHLGQLYLS